MKLPSNTHVPASAHARGPRIGVPNRHSSEPVSCQIVYSLYPSLSFCCGYHFSATESRFHPFTPLSVHSPPPTRRCWQHVGSHTVCVTLTRWGTSSSSTWIPWPGNIHRPPVTCPHGLTSGLSLTPPQAFWFSRAGSQREPALSGPRCVPYVCRDVSQCERLACGAPCPVMG